MNEISKFQVKKKVSQKMHEAAASVVNILMKLKWNDYVNAKNEQVNESRLHVYFL